MELVYVGKIVNTHGINGELRILSDFELKNKIFNKGSKIFVDSNEYIIDSYRFHKIFDMITLIGYNNINDVLFLKGKKVYCRRDDLNLNENEYLISDLIGMDVYYNNELIGIIKDISRDKNPLIKLSNNKLIPYNDNFIDSVNLKQRQVVLKNCEGLLWKLQF